MDASHLREVVWRVQRKRQLEKYHRSIVIGITLSPEERDDLIVTAASVVCEITLEAGLFRWRGIPIWSSEAQKSGTARLRWGDGEETEVEL